MPPDPTTILCMLYIRGLVLGLLSDVLQATNVRRPGNEASARTDNCVLRAPRQSPLYNMYAPLPSSISGSAPDATTTTIVFRSLHLSKLTYASSSISVQLKTFLTSTCKAAWCIDAKLTALTRSKCTLIYI